MIDGYLPLCQRVPDQEGWQMNVNLNTLCAIDMRDAPELLAEFRLAAHRGINSYETALAASQAKPIPPEQSGCAYGKRGILAYDYACQKQAMAEELVEYFEELSAGFLNAGRS